MTAAQRLGVLLAASLRRSSALLRRARNGLCKKASLLAATRQHGRVRVGQHSRRHEHPRL